MNSSRDNSSKPDGVHASPIKKQDIQQMDPNDWSARKLAASLLYDFEKYSEAAELIWDAPELPYKSQDIAFSVRIIAKGNKKNAIRLVNEVVKRNGKNAEGCLRLARAFHKEGLPLIASRMYGAALAVSNENFDIGFENESLWFDDHGALVKEWLTQGYEPQPNEPSSMKEFLGKEMSFLEYTQRITQRVTVADLQSESAVKRPVITSGIPQPPKLSVKLPALPPAAPILIPKARPVDEK